MKQMTSEMRGHFLCFSKTKTFKQSIQTNLLELSLSRTEKIFKHVGILLFPQLCFQWIKLLYDKDIIRKADILHSNFLKIVKRNHRKLFAHIM